MLPPQDNLRRQVAPEPLLNVVTARTGCPYRG